MKIWVDADACPKAIKEILFRAAKRAEVQVTLVANQALRTPSSQHIKSRQVSAGIPLAAQVIEKGAHALNPRGELYTPDNIKARLSLRDFMAALRDSGTLTGGPAPLGPSDRQAFANHLDRLLAKRAKP